VRNLFLFLRRIAGFFGLVFGGRQAREARKQLKKLDTGKYASRIVSDAVLMNDIPSPVAAERLRMDFVRQRLGEFGISNVFTDGAGNVLALFPAYGTRRDFILLTAEIGDAGYSPLENAVRLSGDRAIGRGLGANSLGAAALLVFAEFAQATGFHLDKNLLLLFTPSSEVDERETAFRSFLDEWGDRIACGLLVRGTGLGLVDTRHVGSYRLSLTVRSEDHELLSSDPQTSAATILGAIAARIGAVTAPGQASVSIARMEAGSGFGRWSTTGEMDVEIVAEDDRVLEELKAEVTRTVEGAAAGAKIGVDTLVRLRRSVGDPQRNAPLVAVHKRALAQVLVTPEDAAVSDKVSLLNERGIPALSVGLTTETGTDVDLKPIASGFLQLLLVVEGSSQVAGRED
jgi:hypothetical protein